MTNAIAGIDHVIVGVRDLELAREGWSRLGFTLSPRGRHIGLGTGNYCIMFASEYIELLGIVDSTDFVSGSRCLSRTAARGATRSWSRDGAVSEVEAEAHDVAVLYDVIRPFQAHAAGIPGTLLAAIRGELG